MSAAKASLESHAANIFNLARALSFEDRNVILSLAEQGHIPAKFRHLENRNGRLLAARMPESFVVAIYFIVLGSARDGVESTIRFRPETVLDFSIEEIRNFERGKVRRTSDIIEPLCRLVDERHGNSILSNALYAVLAAMRELVRFVQPVTPVRSSFLSHLFESKLTFPASEQRREDFVRELAGLRIGTEGSRVLESLGVSSAKHLDRDATMLLPEASILKIVEQYIDNKRHPIPDQLVIRYLNGVHRESLQSVGVNLAEMPPPYAVRQYCHHFVAAAHDHGLFIPTEAWTSEVTNRAFRFCRGSEIAIFLNTDFALG